ncbi:MAG: translesion error-prone DNA polymerase V autoproteolytic subunit [Alcanivoracaceae bacterium]|nr:translesion error-prone DNA polymerase V autoproteolytic subunit [Alcanivoracaceae bacterium]
MSRITILTPIDSKLELPLYETNIPAGFPSPAEEYLGDTMDLNQYLIKNATASFFARVEGESMIDAGIYAGDLVVVDRSLTATDGNIVIAAVNNEFTIKRLSTKNGIRLMPANKAYQPIVMSGENELVIWGVVTSLIRKF